MISCNKKLKTFRKAYTIQGKWFNSDMDVSAIIQQITISTDITKPSSRDERDKRRWREVDQLQLIPLDALVSPCPVLFLFSFFVLKNKL